MGTQQIIAEAIALTDAEKINLIAKVEESLHVPQEIDLAQRREAMSRLDHFRNSTLKLSSAESVDDFVNEK